MAEERIRAYFGASIFDGRTRREGAALLVADGRVKDILPGCDVEPDVERIALGGGLLAPGFVDLQVNGGGGVLFNDAPTVEGIAAICGAHALAGGTTALLPTVITDRPETMFAAMEAAERAMRQGLPGCAGIHVEGPFIAPARRGAHDPALVRTMEAEDLSRIAASPVRPFLLTLAPESASFEQIAALAGAGIRVCLGHTDCTYETAMAAFAAGATGVTHLFNAMSPLGHRAPGLVGAALDAPNVSCGIIADGHHVHPAALRAAIAAKRGPGRVLSVSDAMPTVGWDGDRFVLGGREVTRSNGRLTLPDGTLAGSDLSMVEGLRYLVETVGVPLDKALAMSGAHPAAWLGLAGRGHLSPGARADFVHLGSDLSLRAVWIGGEAIDPPPSGDRRP